MSASDKVLTEKQEAFCIHFVQTGNAAKAYRESHEVDENSRDDWIYVEACQMLNHPKIAPRIKELRAKATEVAAFGILDAIDEYDAARLLAMKIGMPSAAVAAITGKVKVLGLDDKPVQLHHSSPDGSMTPTSPVSVNLTGLTDEELSQLELLTDKARNTTGMGEAE